MKVNQKLRNARDLLATVGLFDKAEFVLSAGAAGKYRRCPKIMLLDETNSALISNGDVDAMEEISRRRHDDDCGSMFLPRKCRPGRTGGWVDSRPGSRGCIQHPQSPAKIS